MDEAKFKQQIRKSLCAKEPLELFEWPVTDSMRCGTADFFYSYRGVVVACEGKYIQAGELPQRESSKVLNSCPVTMDQFRFLKRYQMSGSPAIVLIGVGGNVAAYTQAIQLNYTKKELLAMPRLRLITPGIWDVQPLLELSDKWVRA